MERHGTLLLRPNFLFDIIFVAVASTFKGTFVMQSPPEEFRTGLISRRCRRHCFHRISSCKYVPPSAKLRRNST